jgi:hypothetical protein
VPQLLPGQPVTFYYFCFTGFIPVEFTKPLQNTRFHKIPETRAKIMRSNHLLERPVPVTARKFIPVMILDALQYKYPENNEMSQSGLYYFSAREKIRE